MVDPNIADFNILAHNRIEANSSGIGTIDGGRKSGMDSLGFVERIVPNSAS